MPRNAAGVYALPDPPRQPNTVIDSPDENITRDDIATELTNSLDRNGRGGMLAPFRIADGTLAAPGLAFLNEPGTGLWRAGAADMRIAVQGADVIKFTTGYVTIPATAHLTALDHVYLSSGAALFFDGVGGNTFLRELPVDTLQVVVAGAVQTDFIGTPGAANHITITGSVAGNPKISSVGAYIQIDATAFDVMSVRGNTQIRIDFEKQSNGRYWSVQSDILVPNDFGFYDRFFQVPIGVFRASAAGETGFAFIAGNPNPMITTSSNGGVINFGRGITLPSGQALYVDGGSDTYIVENGPDVMDFVIGGGTRFRLRGGGLLAQFFTGMMIPSGQALYLDGGSNTFILEGAPDRIQLFAGGVAVLGIGGGGLGQFNAGISIPSGQALYFDGGSDTMILESAADRVDIICGGGTSLRVQNANVTAFSNLTIQGQGGQCVEYFVKLNGKTWRLQTDAQFGDDFGLYSQSGAKVIWTALEDGRIYFPNIGTTASGANAVLENGNELRRSTSVMSAKKEVQSIAPADAKALISALHPFSYASTLPNDDPLKRHYGFGAEEVYALDKKLVHINEKDEPDCVFYDRFVVPYAVMLNDHETRLTRLEARLP